MLVDILIFPSYAKFIFSISDDIKEKILDFIFYFVTIYMNLSEGVFDIKLFNFLKTYYVNENDHRVNQSKFFHDFSF
jgi:hypothetical protein